MGETSRILAAIEAAKVETIDAGRASAQRLRSLLKAQHAEVIAELRRIETPIRITVVVSGQSIHVPGLTQEVDMSYTVARDHADEPFTLDPIVVSDSEGPVDKPFTETFESDNPDVVSVDAAAGLLHFGTFGGANLTRKVAIDGQEFIVATAVFNVTPGALTVSGNINVPGLTPDPE